MLVNRFAQLLMPWHVYEYPGARIVLAGILGIAPSYARPLLKPSYRSELPPRHASRLAGYLEAHAAESQALALELRALSGKQLRSGTEKKHGEASDRRRRSVVRRGSCG